MFAFVSHAESKKTNTNDMQEQCSVLSEDYFALQLYNVCKKNYKTESQRECRESRTGDENEDALLEERYCNKFGCYMLCSTAEQFVV